MTNDKYDKENEKTQTAHADDPRMTAYLLDELDSAQKEQWEQMLRENPSLQTEVDAMKRTIDLVRETLSKEPLIPGHVPVAELESTINPTAPTTVKNSRTSGLSYIKMFGRLLAVGTACVVVALAVLLPVSVGKFGCSGSNRGELARQVKETTDTSNISEANVQEPVRMEQFKRTDNDRVESNISFGGSGGAKKSEAVKTDSPSRAKAPVVNDSKYVIGKPVYTQKSSESMSVRSSQTAGPRRDGSVTLGESTNESPVASARMNSKPSSLPSPSAPSPSVLPPQKPPLAQKAEGSKMKTRKRSSAEVAQESDGLPNPTRRPFYPAVGGEGYNPIKENDFVTPKDEPFSTFSIDVDTASYSNVRRFLDMGQLPPPQAVKIEELVNYFEYDYTPPQANAKEPFASAVEIATCPWEKEHLLVRIAIKGKEIPKEKRPPLNLVFLIDVSGSMSDSNKLPLVKRALEELVGELDERDQVAIVTYAGSSKVHLETTNGKNAETICRSIDRLNAGGSTAGADGIRTAYDIAIKEYNSEAVNRVVLCTDGDFNVGTTNNKELENLIAQKAKSGVFLSILGFGMGNYKDDRLATLSNRGNGNYGYIDDINEARRLLVNGLTGTLVTIAKDVKIQIDFNPRQVAAWRLIGYEDRLLAAEDFHNDRKDAGEIGAGHDVTALYEIVPVGSDSSWRKQVDQSRYGDKKEKKEEPPVDQGAFAEELMFVKLRYKEPDGNKSTLITFPVSSAKGKEKKGSGQFEFAASVALFGMLLRDSQYSGEGSWDMVLELANALKDKSDPIRTEYIALAKKAKRLSGSR